MELSEKMPEVVVWVKTLLPLAAPLIRVILFTVVGIPLLYAFSKMVRRRVAIRYTEHHGMLASKIVFYAGFVLILLSVMDELNVFLGWELSLKTLLGAAGIVGIAIGFASQTSVSNIISGMFLIAEKPFVVNDVVKVGEITGQILSIDLLSIKLRTFDNRFVRIPNEVIIKTPVINISRFPIRRLDLKVETALGQDLPGALDALVNAARRNPSCLQEPEARVMVTGFTPTSSVFLLSLWVVRENWQRAHDSVQQEIRARLGENVVSSAIAGPGDLSA